MSDADAPRWGRELPILTEWDESSGSLGAYFHQDGLVARWVFEECPLRHVDVGSRIDGFIGHLAVFREVEVLDIRPQQQAVRNVVFHQLDLMEPLPDAWVECADSLSCLHTIEHFGLGRYGDSIDPKGHLKGLEQLKRMVKPGGRLYLSTPIGANRGRVVRHRLGNRAIRLSGRL
jgi:SAM-dependent methyltransferase